MYDGTFQCIQQRCIRLRERQRKRPLTNPLDARSETLAMESGRAFGILEDNDVVVDLGGVRGAVTLTA